MTRTSPAVTVRRPIRAFRGSLLAASVLGLVFAAVALVGYPAPPEQNALCVVVVALLSGCAVLAWMSARVPALQQPIIRRLAVRFGLLCDACWIVEMVTANLVSLPTGSGFGLYLVIYRHLSRRDLAGACATSGGRLRRSSGNG